MRYVRITCLPISAPSERPITIDAIVDDRDEIVGNHRLFGVWGKVGQDQESYYPLVLHGDGVLDYGDGLDAGADRYFDFDLRAGKIAVNRVLSYKSRDRAIVVGYLIDDIALLPAKA
jgi:hypothetical protein